MPRTPAITAVLRTMVPDARPVVARILALAAMAVITVALLSSPRSPLAWSALASPEQSAEAALQQRLDVADGWASDAVRARALWQASLLAETELQSPDRALSLINRLVTEHLDSDYHHAALAQRARILERRSPARAAKAWATVAVYKPGHLDAGIHWLHAGDLKASVNDSDGAIIAYQAAAQYPAQAAHAWLAIGRLSLSEDPAEAHAAYDRALQAAKRPAMVRMARLGVATALERLEGREAALAEVDEAIAEHGADRSLSRRWDRLRNGG